MANILVFGDSITQGHYDIEGGWVDRIKRCCIQKSLNTNLEKYYEVYNLGRAGDTSSDLLKRFSNELKARYWSDPVTLIIIAVGINDSEILLKSKKNLVPKKKFVQNLEKIIKVSEEYTDKVILIGLTPIEEKKVNPIPWNLEKAYISKEVKIYDKIIQDFCKENNFTYIYLYDKLSFEDLVDGAHPNTKGHEIIFETVKNFLEEKKYI